MALVRSQSWSELLSAEWQKRRAVEFNWRQETLWVEGEMRDWKVEREWMMRQVEEKAGLEEEKARLEEELVMTKETAAVMKETVMELADKVGAERVKKVWWCKEARVQKGL